MPSSTNRRRFLKTSLVASLGIAASPGWAASAKFTANKLPRWRGFNLLDFFSPDATSHWPRTSEDHLRWMADWGFDFVRIPMAYPYYLDFDRTRPITRPAVRQIDERRVEEIDRLIALAHKHGLHVSLNLHRAPGYCVNAGFHEPYNLWRDEDALADFCFHWNYWATRYRATSRDRISFDLVNEPSTREDMNDQHSPHGTVPGAVYRRVAQAAAAAIRAANPGHLIIADGNDTGTKVIPELADLDIAQSCRGYQPGIISHFRAPWAYRNVDQLPEPKWPGTVEFSESDPVTGRTKTWTEKLSRELLEEAYRPWIDLKNQGVGVHCGECGCWNQTPHGVFLAWFRDVLDILTTNGVGYALWQFDGDFGVLNSGRTDVDYAEWRGQKLDRELLALLQAH